MQNAVSLFILWVVLFQSLSGPVAAQSQQNQFTKTSLLTDKEITALASEISGLIAKDTVTELARYHRVQASSGFSKAAQYIADKAKEYGLSQVQIERFPADGEKTYYTLKSAPGWEAERGELWEIEHGPRGGDELNLIEKGKNYGWPLVSFGQNYNRVPIPKPSTRADLAMPVLYWDPIIAPGNLMFYTGKMFPQWNGSGLTGGLESLTLNRIIFDGHGGAKAAERWNVGRRIRDVEQGPDGSLWMLEDAVPGALIHVTPR